jgi:hypothetical protein
MATQMATGRRRLNHFSLDEKPDKTPLRQSGGGGNHSTGTAWKNRSPGDHKKTRLLHLQSGKWS